MRVKTRYRNAQMLYMILELNKKFKESYDEDRSD
jgi:hypothetical protein